MTLIFIMGELTIMTERVYMTSKTPFSLFLSFSFSVSVCVSLFLSLPSLMIAVVYSISDVSVGESSGTVTLRVSLEVGTLDSNVDINYKTEEIDPNTSETLQSSQNLVTYPAISFLCVSDLYLIFGLNISRRC